MSKNLTRAQAERFFNAFVKANTKDISSDSLSFMPWPRLVEDWDGHRWVIMWDWADYYYGGTVIPEFKAMFGEPVNSMVLGIYPC